MHTPYRGVEYTCTSRTSGRTSLEVLRLPSKSYYSTRSSKKSWHSYVHRCIAEVGNLRSPRKSCVLCIRARILLLASMHIMILL